MNASQKLADLIYRIGGDTSAFDEAMRKLDGRSAKSARDMEKEFDRTGKSIAAMGANLAKRFIGPLSVAGLVASLRQAADGMAQIGEEAKRANLSTKVFQEWKFVAEQARVPVDAVVDAFKELNIRADEFVKTGKGSAAEAFARLGMSREEVQRRLRDPSTFMQELIERTKALRNTAAGIRIFDELFGGTGGERFVAFLHQGEGAIRDQIKAAHDLGLVIDDKLIKRAEEVDRKFRLISTTVSTNLKSAIIAAADALSTFIDRFTVVEKRQTDTIKLQLAEAERNLTYAQRGLEGSLTGVASKAFEKQIAHSQAEIERLRAILRDRALTAITPQLQSLRDGGVATKGDRPGYQAPDDSDSRKRSTAATKEQRDAAAELIKELEHELSLIGQSELQKAKLNALRRAGAEATGEQKEKIEKLVEALHKETEAAKQAEDAQKARAQALDNLFDMGADGIMSIVEKSATAEEAIKRLAVQLALAAAQAALLGSGPLAGLFGGGLFGGSNFVPNTTAADFFRNGFSRGAANTGGSRGEPRGVVHGQEAVIPLPGSGKVPVELLMPQLPELSRRSDAAPQRQEVILHVAAEEGEMFRPTIRAEAQGVSVRVVDQFSREALPVRVNQIASDPYAIG